MGPRAAVPAHTLSEDHFLQAPVWRFVGPDDASDPDADESYVTPHSPDLGEYGSYLVRATYTLKNGMHLPGFVEVGTVRRKLEFTPGAVFAEGKTVEALGKEATVRLARLLKSEDTQPIAWELDVLLFGENSRRMESIEKPGFAQALSLLMQLGRLRRMR